MLLKSNNTVIIAADGATWSAVVRRLAGSLDVLWSLAFVMALAAPAQALQEASQVTIAGEVRDARTGEPLQGVIVRLRTGPFVETDSRGWFQASS